MDTPITVGSVVHVQGSAVATTRAQQFIPGGAYARVTDIKPTGLVEISWCGKTARVPPYRLVRTDDYPINYAQHAVRDAANQLRVGDLVRMRVEVWSTVSRSYIPIGTTVRVDAIGTDGDPCSLRVSYATVCATVCATEVQPLVQWPSNPAAAQAVDRRNALERAMSAECPVAPSPGRSGVVHRKYADALRERAERAEAELAKLRAQAQEEQAADRDLWRLLDQLAKALAPDEWKDDGDTLAVLERGTHLAAALRRDLAAARDTADVVTESAARMARALSAAQDAVDERVKRLQRNMEQLEAVRDGSLPFSEGRLLQEARIMATRRALRQVRHVQRTLSRALLDQARTDHVHTRAQGVAS